MNLKLQQSGEELIPASHDAVWAFLTDPDEVGHCLPDMVSVTVHDATHFDAVVRVAVASVRGNFKVKLELVPDEPERKVDLRITGGGFGSVVGVTAGAHVVDNGDATSTVKWTVDAEARGPVAAVGSRVLEAQAKKLIGQTFACMRQHVMKS